jgi:hypothetical protein
VVYKEYKLITYKKNNKDFEILLDGKCVGLISKVPDSPKLMFRKMWTASVCTNDGSLQSVDFCLDIEVIKRDVERLLS